ncbi:CocE/NonD family hydrolase [Streptomyces sp. NPDC020794]|uniref:CocE/NonD family hydrolase n=1 Tax=Streptomyces sp. NPDC020794 TaxID=3365090 RepID=UPI00379C7A15
MRVPYGRAGMLANSLARPLAERGFQVLIQSTRGTLGSDGPFDQLRREREDDLDTLDWVIKQPWFGESMILYGPTSASSSGPSPTPYHPRSRP